MPHATSGSVPGTSPLFADRDSLPDLLAALVEETSHFFTTLPQRRAGAIQPFAERLPPTQFRGGFARATALVYDEEFGEGRGAIATLRHCIRRFDELIVASSSPRYLGYATGGVTPAALAGDWLTSVYDQDPRGLTWFGDASGRIEYDTILHLLNLLGLSANFNGGFVPGATTSHLTGLATARQWAGALDNHNVARNGSRKPVIVYAATPHATVSKALGLLGLGTRALHRIPSLPGREAIDVTELARTLEAAPAGPMIVVATAGTNTADFDDIYAILALRERFRFWLHVDATAGCFAALLSDTDRLRGWESADSIAIDNHHWLNVPHDSATWFVRKEHEVHQLVTFRHEEAHHAPRSQEHFDYTSLSPDDSRRLRALPVWFTLRAYGRQGYADIASRCVAAASAFGEQVAAHPRLQLLAPVRLNVVAFTVRNAGASVIDRLLQTINDNGRYFLSRTVVDGRVGLRAAFYHWQTSERDVRWLYSEIQSTLASLTSTAPAHPPKS
ncbi:pyridoxal-dependent decarboxylase [Lewinella sp. JB7]|uniref:pyridoxal phosphate-dependent decarboxylase family protein n=1 Tax=Lewinella sp. JB7 TaxID=2962887 RepID=UPI0020C945E2|nr:pyridoxal-dependent decarboxylase [Lewinella sp. JB7]MCP9237356.1 pyridoxal-dependent decarboxylase [Lewinella sp. JB7]